MRMGIMQLRGAESRRDGSSSIHGKLTMGMEKAPAWIAAARKRMCRPRHCWVDVVEKGGDEAHESLQQHSCLLGRARWWTRSWS
jgi:hypothetical protein